MGDVLNEAPEQRHTCDDKLSSFLRLLPSIRISYARSRRKGSGKDVRYVRWSGGRRSGNIGESDRTIKEARRGRET